MNVSIVLELVTMDNQDIITFIDSGFYKAAAKGQIDPFNGYKGHLNLLLTPTKNTILHIHITQQQKGSVVSVSFMEQILSLCPSLLLQTNNRGETPLHMAARHGHKIAVQFLIDSAKVKHQDIEMAAGAALTMLRMENIDKETALHEAVRRNHPFIVEILTKEDPDFTYSTNKLGETPLYLAVERENRDMVFRILDTCTSPSFVGPNGRTAVHEAVIRNSSEMTAKLVEVKKTVAKEVDQQGWAPLHYASHFGHLSIVKLLLECDKSVAYVADKAGMIPLHHLAASCGHSHERVVLYILEHCPDCHELVDHKGRNVLHFAVPSRSHSLLTHLLNGSDENDHYLPLMTNLINQKDVDGNTPVHWLANYCFANLTLIKHPLVDKMAVNNNNSTPRDVNSKSINHEEGLKAFTVSCMQRVGGYNCSGRNSILLRDEPPKATDMEKIKEIKTAHIIVATLVVTVTFTAGFTIPGGYDATKGTARLSNNGAFATFVITDALALLLSTCALFFYYFLEFEFSKRRKVWLLFYAGLFIMVSIFLMLIAFTAAVFAVLNHSTNLRIIICVITSFSALICYPPLKYYFAQYL